MPRRNVNMCASCGECAASDACVICDKDLCHNDQFYLKWWLYYADRTAEYRGQDRQPDMKIALGPFCSRCWSRIEHAMKYGGGFENRFEAATQNVGNAIAREMFRGREEHDE